MLGRIVTIPYFPLGPDVLRGIATLKIGAVAKRMRAAHGATLTYDDDVMDYIIDQCRDPVSGGRMIDNIITNSILPDLSREVLARMVAGDDITNVTIKRDGSTFNYEFG